MVHLNQTEPQPNDFVLINPSTEETYHRGVVLKTSNFNGKKRYHIQLWNENGPMAVVSLFTSNEVSLHPSGREAVMDDSSKMRFNKR